MTAKEQRVLLRVIQQLGRLFRVTVPEQGRKSKKALSEMEEQEKKAIHNLFKNGWSSERVRARYKKFSRQQIAAIKAHTTMGTYR